MGDWGEEQGCNFLTRHGFGIVERNYRATRGEIDIIAVKGGDFYFVEVKTRCQGDLANNTAITFRKKQILAKTSKAYCYERQVAEVATILAGLLVVVDRINRKVNFNFCVLY